MTPAVTVVGSGASGVHFALTLLRKGLSVRMLDVGKQAAAPVLPEATLNGLKRELTDPVSYFLGEDFGAALLPGEDEEYYGLPPGKDYVFEAPPGFHHESRGFAPLFSFARGGLAQAWTAGCYPLNQDELVDFPVDAKGMLRCYSEVASRIGVTGDEDDLARFMPVHEHLMAPLRLDEHSARLLATYERKRESLNRRGVFLGRTRVATLSQPFGNRKECTYLGRCLWGCPRGALYTPSHTLQECLTHDRFEYIPGVRVTHLRLGAGGGAVAVVGEVEGGGIREFQVDRVALAAGTLLSTRIFLATIQAATGERVRLSGLMDNRQVLVPFVNLGMLGRSFSAESYQYHLLGMGLTDTSPRDYVHAQITTLKTALVHPLLQRIPFDLRTSLRIFRALHAALGILNVNFRDTRRPDNTLELDEGGSLRIRYVPEADEQLRVASGVRRLTRALRSLGCVVPPGMAHVRPMGASVHYAGTLPMSTVSAPYSTTEWCESRDVGNLYLVDGSTFPFLPAKNLTFTLMANAVRVAEAAF